MEAIVRRDDKMVLWINGVGHGRVSRKDSQAIPLPGQDVSEYWDESEAGASFRPFKYPGSLSVYDHVLERLIDRDTGKAIDEAAHPFAGLQEEIGILRADLAALHVQLGSEPTEGFVRLNEIASAAIQAAAEEKEALDESSGSIENAAE